MELICPNCHHAFTGRLIRFSGEATNITISDVYDRCPECRASVAYPNGRFDFDKNGIATLLSGPEFTPDVIASLLKLAQQAKANPEVAQNFTAEANAILPSLGDRLETFFDKKKGLLAFLYFLIPLLLSLYLASKSSAPTVINNTTINNYSTPAPAPPNRAERRRRETKVKDKSHLTPKKPKRKPRVK